MNNDAAAERGHAPPNRPTVGIALSGGGARGVAHIGVLKALLEAGIRPTVVAGCSSGAIVGTLYAAGRTVDEMRAFAQVGSALKLLRLGNPLRGLIKLTLLREKLDAVLAEDTFEALDLPLVVATSDLQRGRLALFRSGELIAPVQASCAIPLVFNPVEIADSQYIDGGLFMNLPAEPIRYEVDFLIGSNVMPHVNLATEKLDNIIAIGSRVFDLSINITSAKSRGVCDFLIEPEALIAYSVYNFTRTDHLIQAGYDATVEVLPALQVALARVQPRAKASPTPGVQMSSTRQSPSS